MSTQAVIRGLGYYAPPRILTNADLEGMVETSDEWITTRTGIKELHIAEPGTPLSAMAIEAAKTALDSAGMVPGDLTHIFVATITPDYPCPSTACILEEKLGLKGLVAMDVNAACSGFLYCLQTARAYVSLDPSAVVLVTAGDVLTSRTNWTDRNTCVLFGDAMGAAIVTAADKACPRPAIAAIEDLRLASDGAWAGVLGMKGGGSAVPYSLGQVVGEEFFVHMNGQEVFKQAVRSMEAICHEILDKNGVAVADIDVLLPHQANLRIIELLGNKLGVPREKVFVNVDRFGNTSAASVGVALADAMAQGVLRPGMRVLVATFGAGFTWGSALLRF